MSSVSAIKDDSSTSLLPTQLYSTLCGHEGSVLVVRFSRNGEYCLTGSQDHTIKLWNPHRGLMIRTYRGHAFDVYSVDIEPTNERFVSGGGDKSVFLWDVSTGNTIRRFRGHNHRVNCVRLNADGSVVVSGSYDKTVKFWDLRARGFDAMQTIDVFRDSVSCITVQDYLVAAGSVDGSCRVFDVRRGECTVDEFPEPVTSVSVSHDQNCLLVASLDSSVRLLDRSNGDALMEYSQHKNGTYRIDAVFTNDDSHFAVGSEDNRVCFYNVLSENIVSSIDDFEHPPVSLDYNLSLNCLLVGSVDKTARLYVGSDYNASRNDAKVHTSTEAVAAYSRGTHLEERGYSEGLVWLDPERRKGWKDASMSKWGFE